MYTLTDVIEMFDLSERTVRRHLKQDVLKGAKVSGKWHFTDEDLGNYLSQTVVSTALKQKSVRDFFEFSRGIGEKAECFMVSKNITIKPTEIKDFSKKVGSIKGKKKFDLQMKLNRTNVIFYGTREAVKEFLDLV